jgi:hypothetical protein
MRIKNDFKETIYWRAFKGDDTVYIVGLNQGSIAPKGTGEWRDDSFPNIKVEVKTGDIVFSKQVLAPAGRRFGMGDDLVVDSKGKLDTAKVARREITPVIVQRTDLQFFDARNFNEATTREITFSIENAFSASEGFQQSHEHSQTWTAGGKVGGEIGKKNKGSARAEVSVRFEDKVVDALASAYTKQVTTVWKQSVSDTFTFRPGKIYAIEVTWRVQLHEGDVSYFGEKTSYSVVSSAHGTLTTPSAFESVAEMPEKLREQFESYHRHD